MKAQSILIFASQAAALAVRSKHPLLNSAAMTIERVALDKRTVCEPDNLLRNFRDARFSSSADQFCSGYIQSTVFTIVDATATDQVTVTEIPPPVIVTDIAVVPVTVTTGTVTLTKYTTIPDSRYNKRAADAPYPSWLPATYPPSRVSSACSCFIPSPSPAVQITETITVKTETVVATETLPQDTTTIKVTSTAVQGAVTTQIVNAGGVKCGIKGCIWADTAFSLGNAANVGQCKAMCMASNRCLSFHFGPAENGVLVCNLSFVNADQAWSNVSPSVPLCSGIRIYDRFCEV